MIKVSPTSSLLPCCAPCTCSSLLHLCLLPLIASVQKKSVKTVCVAVCTRSVLNRCHVGMGCQEVVEKIFLMSIAYKICITFANCIARRFNPPPWLSEGLRLPEDILSSWQLSERHPSISMDNYN